MPDFTHYAVDPHAVAEAERALSQWRREALAERRKAERTLAPNGRLERAERRIRELRAFLGPRTGNAE